MPDTAHEIELGQLTLIAFNRAITGFASLGALDEHEGAVLCAGGSWIPVIANTAFRADPSVSGTKLIAWADEFFGFLNRGYAVHVRDSSPDKDLRRACEMAGLEPFGNPTPDMLCVVPLSDAPVPDGITLRDVIDEPGVRDFVSVNAEAYNTYGMPGDVLEDLFDETKAVLADPACDIVVAYRGEEPVATALVYASDGAATVQWVGTKPAARSLGLGALVTAHVTNLAFARGASSVTLQASPMGAPIYLRMGYVTTHHATQYVRWRRPGADTDVGGLQPA